MGSESFAGKFENKTDLSFLWLELTNRCNLECLHCYAGSSPDAVDENPLEFEQYSEILSDSFEAGCRSVQFIGGEPTLNRQLPMLIDRADEIGFADIEVFTNLVSLPSSLLAKFKQFGVRIATSVYSNDPVIHDQITTRIGSWEKTKANIARVLDAGLSLRASIIIRDENRGTEENTKEWLRTLGVENSGTDDERDFGRASSTKECSMGELCGQCAHGTLCVSPEGEVSPCIMSKSWSVGSTHVESISDILASEKLAKIRADIFEATNPQFEMMGGCQPDNNNTCGPDSGNCNPCSPNGHCGPNSCRPK